MEPNIAIPKLGCSERKHDFEEKLSLQMNCHEVLVKITNQAALMYGIKGRLICSLAYDMQSCIRYAILHMICNLDNLR